jgi:hypothetical protein
VSGPQPFRWTGSAMEPLRPRAADRAFVIGEVYTLETVEQRSGPQHRFYFAALAEAWRNLPDALAEEYPDAETLRKKALIRTGYRDERSIVCASKAEARRVAAFVAPMDRYAIVAVSESVVRVWTAKSQSMRAMGRQEFGESIEAVLAFCAGLIGVAPDALKNADAA